MPPQKSRDNLRWEAFMLALVLLYTVECVCMSPSISDTWIRYIATVLQLGLFYQTIKNPRKLPVRLYCLLLPIVLSLSVYGNYLVRPSYYELPIVPFLGSWLLLQLPIFLWSGSATARLRERRLLPYVYLLLLFCIHVWTVPPEHLAGAYVHYEYTASYMWLSLILPAFIVGAAGRRAVRIMLTQVNLLRSFTLILAGLSLIILWQFIAASGFRLCGLNVSVLLLGTTVPADVYRNLPLALLDHLMFMTGTFIYVALGEELFFRLFLPAILRAKLRLAGRESYWTTLFLSALIFGTIHWSQASPVWTKIIYSFVSALIFASLRHWSRNMQVPTVVHAITNDLPRLTWS